MANAESVQSSATADRKDRPLGTAAVKREEAGRRHRVSDLSIDRLS